MPGSFVNQPRDKPIPYRSSTSLRNSWAERVPEQIAHLVYLDGVVPQDGQSDLDVLGPVLAAEFEAWAASHGDS